MADRHFCMRSILQSLQQALGGLIVREHARHPSIVIKAAKSKRL